MPGEFDDLSKVRHVRRGDPVAEKPTAQPTRALELRLTQLEQLITSITQTGEFGRLVIRDVAIKTGDEAVAVDDIVFFNANTGLYEKALAGVTFLSGAYNSNPSALVLGVCIAVNGNRGDIMIAGYEKWRDSAQKESMVESTEDYVPGVPYFLSDDEAGKVTRFPPALRIQVFMGTDKHFILQPAYSNPDAIETLYRVPMGMRPVGGIRYLPPTYEEQVIVGFDALELVDTTAGLNRWQLTTQSANSAIANFGYMVADAQMVNPLATPIYVRISVNTSGNITVMSAATVADLWSGGAYFNQVTGLQTLTSGTEGAVRSYTLQASAGDTTTVGTLWFKFVTDDVSVRRDIIFKVPDSFQGWKMINAPVTPIATAVVSGGGVVAVNMVERGVGYITPPVVRISGTGPITTEAEALAVLDAYGSIASISITNPGAGYTAATVEFDVTLNSVRVENGGSRTADITLGLTSGEVTSVVIVDGGTNYHSVPSLEVVDETGTGAILQATTTAGVITSVEIVSQGTGYTDPKVIVRPSGSGGYQKTLTGVFQSVLTGDAVTSISILVDVNTGVTGGAGYPINPKVTLVGGGYTTQAEATATVDPVTKAITGFIITTPGTGYTTPPTVVVEEATPILSIIGGNPTTSAEGSLTCPEMAVRSVWINSTGYGYDQATTIALTGGLLPGGVAATVVPEIEAATGRIINIKVLTTGSGYYGAPALVITDPGGDGNGFLAEVELDTWINTATVSNGGSGYKSMPQVGAGVPVRSIEIENSGLNYSLAPTVSIEPPATPAALGGRTATAVAHLGGTIRAVRILSAGSGYVSPVVNILGGGGTGASVVCAVDAIGGISSVDIIDHGYDFTSAPTLQVVGAPGTGAVLEAEIESTSGQVVRIEITDQGHGYTYEPQVTIAPPLGVGVQALGQAKLLGARTVMSAIVNGEGGIHLTQTVGLAQGNRLQIRGYNDDLNDAPTSNYGRPNAAVFYYNIKADPNLLGRWPAIPVNKALFTLNGTEQEATEFNETTGIVDNARADILFTKKTPMWTTFDADGCPWDREFRQFVEDHGATGNDAVIPDTGPTAIPDEWWRFWEHVYKYEPNRNVGHMHVNRASRFYQSGRLAALGVLSPLKLIDVISGAEAKNDGTLMTGQLLLTLDNQVNFLGGTGSQINTATTNNIVPIYQNTTGRPVFVSSIVLQVIYQLNGVAIPSVNDAALITIGTQEGNYRDIVGTIDPSQVTQQGVSTRLYRANSVKEMFPDDRESSPLIMPNQVIYARVDYPVNNATIQAQVLTAKVKGHVF